MARLVTRAPACRGVDASEGQQLNSQVIEGQSSMAGGSFEYDLAISFLAQDEALVERLSLLLDEQYRTFVYSERQRELAGRDGLDSFSAVFKTGARICVVLYRNGWGQTKWTRIEETAIKSRAFDLGWDFLLVVCLDDSAGPAWLPPTKLWLGYERFGIDAVVGAIDSKIQESGGVPKQETAREKAGRLRRLAALDEERRETLDSQQGVDLAASEFAKLAEYLQSEVQAISDAGTPIDFMRTDNRNLSVRSPHRSIAIVWVAKWANTLESSSLVARVFDGPYHPQGIGRGPTELKRITFDFDLDRAKQPVWRRQKPARAFSTPELAESLLKIVVEGAFGS